MNVTRITKQSINADRIKQSSSVGFQQKGQPRLHNTKKEWFEIGGKRFYSKSTYERNYARYLEFLKCNGKITDWEYEPHEFWFLKIMRGVRSYKPDFRIWLLNNKHTWREIKGYMDSESLTKLKRMKKYYPDEDILVVDKDWFKSQRKSMKIIIKEWE